MVLEYVVMPGFLDDCAKVGFGPLPDFEPGAHRQGRQVWPCRSSARSCRRALAGALLQLSRPQSGRHSLADSFAAVTDEPLARGRCPVVKSSSRIARRSCARNVEAERGSGGLGQRRKACAATPQIPLRFCRNGRLILLDSHHSAQSRPSTLPHQGCISPVEL